MKKSSKSPQKMMAAVTDSMHERTGKTLDQWVKVVMSSGLDPLNQNSVRKWLKSEHGILQNSQWAIADAAARKAGWIESTVEEYIDQQYAGPKASLRPIFDQLRQIIEALGDDITIEGRSTYTPFVRTRQFLAIVAATRDRIDIGLRFTQPPTSKLLTPSTTPGQATHKISLTTTKEITAEVKRLLKASYEQNG